MASQTLPQIRAGAIPLATWLKLKADYIHGKGALAVLARAAGITPDIAHKRSAREQWSRIRDEWFVMQNKKLERIEQEQDRQTEAGPAPAADQSQTRAGTVLAQIDRIDQAMLVANPSDLPKLADAKAKLWSLLYPKPGTNRRRRPGQPVLPEPIEPTPVEPAPL
jgi:hypothetical protein